MKRTSGIQQENDTNSIITYYPPLLNFLYTTKLCNHLETINISVPLKVNFYNP